MDIYSYINSSDIADYCQKIGHIFSPLDMAVLVALSEKTMKEKHAAWQAIIANYPDMPIPKNPCFGAKESLHDYLRELITLEENLEEKMLAEHYQIGGAVHRPCVWWNRYADSDIPYEDNKHGSFSTFEKAWKVIIGWKENYGGASSACISKEYIDNGYHIRARVDAAGEVLSISTNFNELNESCPDSLHEIFIHIPVPFEYGDLVEHDGKPCVLTYLPHWDKTKPGITYEEKVSGEKGDGSDMIGNVHYLGTRGIFYYNHVAFYNLKFWHGKIEGQDRFLKHLSGFIKQSDDNIHELTTLISAYCKYTAEAESENISGFNYGLIEKYLEKEETK